MPPQRRPQSAVPDADPESTEGGVVLPSIPCDPYASLDSYDITVSFADREWVVPAMPADKWLKLLWADPFEPDAIFPDLADAAEEVFEGVLEGTVPPDDIFNVAMEILEEASGYRWWFTLRLTTGIKVLWPRLGGMLMLRGIHAQDMSLGAWCTAAYALCVEHLQPSRAYTFTSVLNDPPPGIEDPHAEMANTEAFLSAMSAPY